MDYNLFVFLYSNFYNNKKYKVSIEYMILKIKLYNMIILYMNEDTDNFVENSIDHLLYKCK